MVLAEEVPVSPLVLFDAVTVKVFTGCPFPLKLEFRVRPLMLCPAGPLIVKVSVSPFPPPCTNWLVTVSEAIENALSAAEQERSGLNRRVEDALTRAAVTIGNGTDKYLERDALDSHHQDLFSTEISNGQRRLKELATEITQFKFLKAATLSRFPDFKPISSKN